ncbi:MAG: hypothetical protein ACQKBY_12720, partial [Verrucomicrobiales bacterium]
MKALFLLLAAPLLLRAELRIETRTILESPADYHYFQARSAYIPGDQPYALTTMSRYLSGGGSHNFHDIDISYFDGSDWSRPAPLPSLARVEKKDGYEVAPGDLWPKFHAASGQVL